MSVHAQTEPGQILAAKVEGQVLKVAADGTSSPLVAGTKLAETDTITTAKNSSVVLVFMNGSSVKLGPESRLAIDEFKMDPLAEDIEPSKLQAEPSVSKTTLNLSYGEMVGDVKKLNTSSSYSIKTPVGAAGIRGTIYRVVFRPTSDGKAFFTVQTAEGRVVMEGVTAGEIPIEAGKEVVVEIDVPDVPGGEAAAPVVVTQDIPAATSALIATEAQTITQTVQATTFTPTPPETPTPPPATPAETPAETPLAPVIPPTPPGPDLTPGA
ncbi:FecR family protein [Lacunisphaera limnophila]|uniref:FecR family protein n=1 Tax=Lacunisphaera limnophila TaxID=1838286 RepID=UPI0008598BC3|nr:FecR family protein [Lacunisphaera limnophila]